MNKFYILLFSILILTSCGNKREGEEKTGLLSHLFSLSDNEANGIDEILEFYGGSCEYLFGVSASTNEGTKKYFEIKISQSDAIDELLDKVHLPSSNIAYRFYKNLKEEKKNYDIIKVILISSNNKKEEFDFPITFLEKAEKRIKVAERTISLIKEKQFEELKKMFNDEISLLEKDEFILRLKEIEPQLGNILEFRLFGFKITKIKNVESIHVSAAIIRDKQSNEYSVDLEFNSDKYEVSQIQYEL
ncbi:hypothetical protein [Algibacter sp. Ld11]|uniref:hypothetical protein n=1 Tax=Algibacter sp. Ld11 TaxID=649150 RepID=UPI0038636C72